MLGDALAAEWLKLRKRPATLVLSGVLVAFVLVFSYLVLYLIVTLAPTEAFQGGPDPGRLIDTLLPPNAGAQLAQSVTGIGGALGLILGALTVGSEYSWGTATFSAIQRPPRWVIMAGRALAVLAAMLVFAVLVGLSVVAGSAVVGGLEGQLSGWPGPATFARAFWSSWLVLAVWASLGLALATVFRSSGLAIGVGLVYALVVESVASILPQSIAAARWLRQALIGQNATALTADLSAGPASAALRAFGPDIPTIQAAVVLAVYLAIFVAISVAVFARRELA